MFAKPQLGLLRPSCECYSLKLDVNSHTHIIGLLPVIDSAPSFSYFSPFARCFSTTSPALDWLTPKFMEKSKSPKGRPKMHTGGSTRGTTVVWGDYGLRMKDHDRRVSAAQLKLGAETIKQRLRGMNYKLYTRVSANIGVYTKGNEMRMGKGKGKFDYWAARIPVSRIVFELKGDLHEKVAREAFRLAAHKLPGISNILIGNNGMVR